MFSARSAKVKKRRNESRLAKKKDREASKAIHEKQTADALAKGEAPPDAPRKKRVHHSKAGSLRNHRNRKPPPPGGWPKKESKTAAGGDENGEEEDGEGDEATTTDGLGNNLDRYGGLMPLGQEVEGDSDDDGEGDESEDDGFDANSFRNLALQRANERDQKAANEPVIHEESAAHTYDDEEDEDEEDPDHIGFRQLDISGAAKPKKASSGSADKAWKPEMRAVFANAASTSASSTSSTSTSSSSSSGPKSVLTTPSQTTNISTQPHSTSSAAEMDELDALLNTTSPTATPTLASLPPTTLATSVSGAKKPAPAPTQIAVPQPVVNDSQLDELDRLLNM